ncbi:MAG TPA: CARDB domain-containing protein, partial [Candidatus Methanoperedens sp.]|nr:CARDB domain-containing protein [Candidatus Methanoperedens sp.]
MKVRHFVPRVTRGLTLLLVLGLVFLGGARAARADVIQTLAGGLSGSLPALSSAGSPMGMAFDASGNLYFSNSNSIRRLDSSGMVSTVAGNLNRSGFSGNNGPALSASFVPAGGLAVDPSGTVYFSISQGRVVKVNPGGILSVVAGNGTYNYCGDGSAATAACLGSPQGVTLDQAGNLFIADTGNSRIRKVDTNGIITTFAGNGTAGYTGDGGPATAAQIRPYGIASDGRGNIYFAENGNHVVRKVDTNGIISTVAGDGTLVRGYSGDGGPATSAKLDGPLSIVFDAADNLYVVDAGNVAIRRVDAQGIIATVAGIPGNQGFSGDGGPATQAKLYQPFGAAVNGAGRLFISDRGNKRIRAVDEAGIINTVVGNGTLQYSGDGGPAVQASLNTPSGVGIGSGGTAYVADTYNNCVRKVDAYGVISLVAGKQVQYPGNCGDGGPAIQACLKGPAGVVEDSAGNVYVADSQNSSIRKVNTSGIITTVATLSYPYGLALDDAGNLYVATLGDHRVYRLDPSAILTVVAGNGTPGFCGDGLSAVDACLNGPTGVAVDDAGNIFIAEWYNHRVRKVDAGGIITTIAGNGQTGSCPDGSVATGPCLSYPFGVAVDSQGSLLISSATASRIVKVNPGGYISTVAGSGTKGFCGDGGDPLLSCLDTPRGIALDAGGNLYIADEYSDRIRRVNTGNPVADAGGPYLTGPNAQVTLSASGSYHIESPGHEITGYDWDLDNNGEFETSGMTVYRSWALVGSYPVAVRVTDDLGRTSIDQAIVKVLADPVAAINSITPATSFYGDPVTFMGSNAENLVAWSWTSSRDGVINSSGPVFTTSSLSIGTHTITYQVTDNLGRVSAPAIATLTVRSQAERTDLALEWGDISFWKNGQEVTNPALGETIDLRAVVHNLSDVDSEPVNVEFYDAYNTGEVLIGTATIPGIAGRGAGTAEIAWTAPPTQEGYHVIRVKALQDPLETFLQNNAATHFIMVGTHPAAGQITVPLSVQAPGTVYTGSRFTVSGTAIYHWANGFEMPLMGGEVTIRVLGGESWQTRTVDLGHFSQEIYAPLTAGTYTLVVEVTDATVTGSYTSQLTVNPLPGPDLTVYNVWVASGVATVPDTIYGYVVNRGGVAIASDFLCRAQVTDPSGAQVYDQVVPLTGGLAAGAGKTVAFSGWTPSVSGNYRITVTADSGGTVAEQYETNNALTATVYVYPAHVDLQVLELRQECDTVKAKVQNIGGFASSGVGGLLEFSDESGVYATANLPAIGGKGSSAWIAAPAPYGGSGTHTIRAVAVSPEDANAANNEGSGNFSFVDQVDLTVNDLWLNGQRWSGNNIGYLTETTTLQAEVKNLGCLAGSGTLTFMVDGVVV